MGKPVGRRFVQMGSKNPKWKFPFGIDVYHLHNRPNLPREPRTSLTYFNEIILDASIDEELLLDYKEDGEFRLIAATAAFMKRIVGFCEVVVPSYPNDEFGSHFRMT